MLPNSLDSYIKNGPQRCYQHRAALTTNERMRFDMADSPIKTCSVCQQEKLRIDFYKCAGTRDGLRSACKPCVSATNRASVLRHHEKRKEEKRAVYRAVRDTPEYKEYRKAHAQATKEQKRQYDKLRHSRQSEKVVARAVAWQKANPSRRAAITRSYDARRRSKVGAGVATEILRQWTDNQRKVCYWCGIKCGDGFHVDHYVPLSKGGAHEIANLVIACPSCNIKKNAKDPLDFAKQVGRLL